jgi:hypothetical protein
MSFVNDIGNFQDIVCDGIVNGGIDAFGASTQGGFKDQGTGGRSIEFQIFIGSSIIGQKGKIFHTNNDVDTDDVEVLEGKWTIDQATNQDQKM